jgi:acetyltransferase-like isoleucine patch superfamily enzyme
MFAYLRSAFSLKRFKNKNVSIFALWDKESCFTDFSEIRRFSKLISSSVGKYSRVNPGCILFHTQVGNFTAIGRNTNIGLGQHPTNYISTQNIFYKKNNLNNKWVSEINFPRKITIIGNDVWVGINVIIMDGVKIGDGAVIGAGSIVTKDIPPYAIAVGVPAKVVKYRFTDEVIVELLRIKWWSFSDDQISKFVEIFRIENLSLSDLKRFNISNETNNTRS